MKYKFDLTNKKMRLRVSSSFKKRAIQGISHLPVCLHSFVDMNVKSCIFCFAPERVSRSNSPLPINFFAFLFLFFSRNNSWWFSTCQLLFSTKSHHLYLFAIDSSITLRSARNCIILLAQSVLVLVTLPVSFTPFLQLTFVVIIFTLSHFSYLFVISSRHHLIL